LLFLVISFTGGFLIGASFPIANKIYLKNKSNFSQTAGLLYGLDLFGGWLGGVIGSVVLLPILGILGTCLVVVLLKIISFIVLIVQLYYNNYNLNLSKI